MRARVLLSRSSKRRTSRPRLASRRMYAVTRHLLGDGNLFAIVLQNTGRVRQFSNHAERTSCKNLSLGLRFRTPDLTQGELDHICNLARANSPEPFMQGVRIVPVATTERADSHAGDCLQAEFMTRREWTSPVVRISRSTSTQARSMPQIAAVTPKPSFANNTSTIHRFLQWNIPMLLRRV